LRKVEPNYLYRLCYLWAISYEASDDPLVPADVEKCMEEIYDTMVWRATDTWPPEYPSYDNLPGDALPKDADESNKQAKTCRACVEARTARDGPGRDISTHYCKDHMFAALVLGLPVVFAKVAGGEVAKEPAKVSEGKVAGESDAAFHARQKKRAWLLQLHHEKTYAEAIKMGFTAEELQGVRKDKIAIANYVYHKMAGMAWSAEQQKQSDYDVSEMWRRIENNLRAAAASGVPYVWADKVDEALQRMKSNFISPTYPPNLFGYGHGSIPKTAEELRADSKCCTQCMASRYGTKTGAKFCNVHEFGAVIVGVELFQV
jgi:hypothetical protein